MSTVAITGKIVDPAGTAVVGVTVLARLKPGGFRTSDYAGIADKTTTTDANGAYSFTLERNADISPAGTWYEIEEQIPSASGIVRQHAVNADTSGTVYARLLATPPAVTSSTYLTTTIGDARYAFPGTVAQGTQYVATDGSDSNDGLSWGKAKLTIAVAIDALPAGGGVVEIGEGTFVVSAAKTIPDNVIIRGRGMTTTIISVTSTISGGTHQAPLRTVNGSSHIVITDIGFSIATANSAVSIQAGNNITVRRCRFTGAGAGRAAVHLNTWDTAGIDGVLVEDCRFEQVTGMYAVEIGTKTATRTTKNVTVRHNFFHEVNWSAIKFTAGITGGGKVSNTKILNNTAVDVIGSPSGTGEYGTFVTGGIDQNQTVENVLVEGNYQLQGRAGERTGGVFCYSSTDWKIQNNTFICTTGEDDSIGFAPGRVGFPMVGLHIIGNYVEGWGSFWDPDSMTFAEVAHNVVRTCGPNGAMVGYGTQEHVDIHDNLFYNSMNNPLLPAAIVIGNITTATDVNVHDNLIVDTTNPPVVIYAVMTTGLGVYDSSNVKIHDNTIRIPNGTLTEVLNKQHASNVPPRQIERTDVITSAGYTRYEQIGTYTPLGVTTITPGASPYTYTNADYVTEIVYISGGTVSGIAKNAVTLCTSAPAANAPPFPVLLSPGEAVVVTYSVVPSMWKDRK